VTRFLLLTGVLLLGALLLRQWARWSVGTSTRPHQILYADTGQNDLILTSHQYRLTGRPDYILAEGGERFPMERKSREVDARGAYDSERLQLAAYCLLLEEHTGQPVRRGRLEYRNRTLDIAFDDALRRALHAALSEMHALRSAPDVRRNHTSAARCRGCGCGCGFRRQCSDALAS
jgi:CRISPR-associated exonuclease Cas4